MRLKHGGGGQIKGNLREAADGEERQPDPWRAAAQSLAEDQVDAEAKVDEEDAERDDVDNRSIPKRHVVSRIGGGMRMGMKGRKGKCCLKEVDTEEASARAWRG